MDGAHAREALVEAVRVHLALVPIDEYRIDGDETEPPSHAQRGQEIGLAQPDHGDVERAADFEEARLLEVADDEAVVSGALGLERVADRLRRAAEFGQRMEQMVGRIEPVHLEPDAGGGGRVQQRLQPLDIGRLLDRMHEALIPQPGGRGLFGHMLSSCEIASARSCVNRPRGNRSQYRRLRVPACPGGR